ncbi:MAG: sulfatase-like hydrolase/transferase, partial [bacterium]
WGKFPLSYWKNNEVVIDSVTPKDQKYLTKWYTEDAVDFIARHKDEPFFLYVPHSMPHVPLYVSEKFEGKSGEGLYADVIMELDWSVGEIMNALEESGVDENTMIIFTSDNGPWTYYGDHAGSTPFREAKATSFEGGTRSACIISYPGEIKEGTRSNRAFCSIDILPTICELSGTSLPDYEIDGKNVWELIKGKPTVENPHDYYAFSTGPDFEAIMSADGKWKLHLPHEYRVIEVPGQDGMPGKYGYKKTGYALYDLENDPYEKNNVIEDYPEVKERLMGFAEMHGERYYGQ